jgi:hypothetical protein
VRRDTCDEPTAELLSIPGFQEAFAKAVQEIENGDVVPFEEIRRDDECLDRAYHPK